MLIRSLALMGMLLATPAMAQQVTPSFGLDSAGSQRQLYVRDPTLPGFVPMGTLNTTSHTFTPGTRPVNPEMYGAIGDDAIDDTAAVQAALNSGFPVTGLNKSYRVGAAGLTMPNGLNLQDITLVRTGGTTLATLGNVGGGGSGPFTLRNVKIDYLAIATTAGDDDASFGLEIRNGHDISIDGLEVTGNGKGNAVDIWDSPRVRISHLWVHDIEWTNPTDPLSEQIFGLLLRGTTDSQVDQFKIENLGGSVPWAASTALPSGNGLTWRTNAGKSYRATAVGGTTGTIAPTCTSGTCSDGGVTWTYMGAYPAVRRYYQSDGFDVTNVVRASFSNGIVRNVFEGFDAVGNTNEDVFLTNILYSDIDGWGEKWGHCVMNGGSIGSHVIRAGISGFVVNGGASTDACGVSHLRIVDSMAIDTGANGNWPPTAIGVHGYRLLIPGAPGSRPANDIRFINPLAVDTQAVHTMQYGFATEDANPAAIILINPRSIGAVIGEYANFTSGMIEVLASDGSTKVTGNLRVTGTVASTGGVSGPLTLLDSATILSNENNQLNLITTHDTAVGVNIALRHLRPVPANGDDIGSLYFQGNDSIGDLTDYVRMAGTVSDVVNGTEDSYLKILTRTAGTFSEALRLGGGLMVGASPPTDPGAGSIHTAGFVQVTPVGVGSLPTCVAGLEGAMAGVTNATATTYNSVAAGGGSNHMPVYCNGTAWVLH